MANALPAGMRNNNPGNLKFNPSIDWQGQVGPSVNLDQGDPQVVFQTPELGMRALAKNVLYKFNNGATTINQLIAGPGGWTPGYAPGAAGVASAAGLPADQPLDMSDPNILHRVVRGIVTQEQGPASRAYSDELIAQGMADAGVKQYDPYGNPVSETSRGPRGPAAPPQAATATTPAPLTGRAPADVGSILDQALGPLPEAGGSTTTGASSSGVDAILDQALGPLSAPGNTDQAVGDRAADLRAATGRQSPGYTPSSVPWLDPVAAFADSAIDAIPVVGHPLMGGIAKLDAGLNNLLAPVFGFQPETADQRTAEINANNAAHPVASTAGTITGVVAPVAAVGTAGLGAKLLGTAEDYGLGAVGNVGARIGASGLSGGALAGADTLTRGGDIGQAGENALTGLALGAAAPVVARAIGGPTAVKAIAGGAGLGAAAGGVGTLLTGGTPQQAAQNALTGAAIGGGIPAAIRGAGTLAGKLVAGGVPAPVAQLADAAVNKYGIKLSPAQISTNPFMKMADSVVNRLPLTGGTGSEAAQRGAFTRAIANEMGEDATSLDPSVMGAAKKRIGGVFQSVAANTPKIAEDSQLGTDLLTIMSNAESSVGGSQLEPIEKRFNDIASTFQSGGNAITGKQYLSMTAKGSPLDAMIHSPDPAIANAGVQFREALDAALQRSAAPSDVAALQQARYQWKVMRTVEDMAEKAPTGEVSPALLMGAVRKNFPNMAYDGGGNMGELARIGQQFMKAPPNSGTPERTLVNKLLGLEGAAGGAGVVGLAMNPAAIPSAAAGAALYGVGAPIAGAAMRSKALSNALIEKGLGHAPGYNGAANMLTRSAVPLIEDGGPGEPQYVFRNGKWIPRVVVHATPITAQ